MQYKKEPLNKPLLIIGCGHKHYSCTKPHQDAITVDLEPSINPDYVVKFPINSMPDELKVKKFKAIILEYFPADMYVSTVKSLQDLLEDDGVILILGAGYSYSIPLHIEFKGFYYNSGIEHIFFTKSQDISNLDYCSQLKEYLSSCKIDISLPPVVINVNENKPYCFFTNDTCKGFYLDTGIRTLTKLKNDYNPQNCIDTVCMMNKAIHEKELPPLTKNDLGKYLQTNSPGFFHSNGIEELSKFNQGIANENLPLTDQKRHELYCLIAREADKPNSTDENTIRIFVNILEHLLKTETVYLFYIMLTIERVSKEQSINPTYTRLL